MAALTIPSERIRYPFKDTLPYGETRHHIIPYDQMAKYGLEIAKCGVKAEAYMKAILVNIYKNSAYNMEKYPVTTEHATVWKQENISDMVSKVISATRKTVEESTNEEKEAVEAWFAVISWLPGNLLWGAPATRGKDPHDKFDSEAFEHIPKERQEQIDGLRKTASIDAKADFLQKLAQGGLSEGSKLKGTSAPKN